MQVEVKGVTKTFRSGARTVRAVNGIEQTFVSGESVALVGESGSGKTTLARMIMGLETCSEGSILIDGEPVRKPGQFAQKLQMVFQDPFSSFNPRHSIGYAITRPFQIELGLSRREAHDRAVELLDKVGLSPPEQIMRRMPDELSGGQRQRVSIARAVGGGAQFVVADEPTSMLDVSVASRILMLFRELTDLGVTYIFITHNLAVARYIADRIVVMYRGEVMEDGPADEIVHHPTHDYTKLLLECTPSGRPRGEHA
ncbi:MAG TPA: ATP-binding cassette domain-containing protein [Mycobacteriales bacterium]|nr:ATP-binding cassette domain-containing protein [Mycobacteriales bacterium]